MKLLFALLNGDTKALVRQYQKSMQEASVAAMQDVADIAKANGRKSIAAAGFSTRWQNALRSRVYPNKEKPMSPAALLWHRIAYSEIFETGGKVSGKPLLWLPLPNVPQGRGKHRLTPAEYIERIGPLRPIRTATGRAILIGQGSSAGIVRATPTAVRVRKRAVKSGSILGAWVPLFVGVPAVNIAKRFGVERGTRAAADQLGSRYAAHFTPES